MNILFGFINIIVTFSLVVLIEKLFKKEGLYVWLSIATILANLTVCKMIGVFNFTTSLGNVLFASTFLATDIMSEKYSKKDAKKGVYISIFSGITFIIVTQLTLLFIPSADDVVNDAMKTLFSISIRTISASMIMFFISNMADIHIYNKLKDKYPKKMWLRNNLSTIACNCIENYFFNTLAFIGIFPMSVIISIATTTTIIEIVIALCDTPFLYLSKKLS
ncbi:MAG: queuosine precursor transporter [Bacilli bacterium]|nr:queuosine precursor transporter [Bacilli bacterium]MBQ7240978.1 queuosine precursor transporter [Bacilli bacterium]